MRISKDPEVRRNEIMDTAEQLFQTKGYHETTIMDILTQVGIAKGTFYYYFKSKEEILDGIIERIVAADVAQAEKIAADPQMPVFEKFCRVLQGQKPGEESHKGKMMGQVHHPQNAEMHQKSLVRAITRMAPILKQIVEQGIEEKVMAVAYPRETVEFLLAAGQTIFDEGFFQWPPEEGLNRAKAFVQLMEKALGAEKGSFNGMLQVMLPSIDKDIPASWIPFRPEA